MLMSLFAVGAFAEDVVEVVDNTVCDRTDVTYTISSDRTFATGFTVKPGVTLVIGAEVIIQGSVENDGGNIVINGGRNKIAGLILESGATFYNNIASTPVQSGDQAGAKPRGTLTIGTYGGLRVKLGARIENKADIIGLENDNYVTLEGRVLNYYTLPALKTVSYNAEETYDGVAHSVTYTPYYLHNGDMTTDVDYTHTDPIDPLYTAGAGQTVAVEYKNKMYVLVSATFAGTSTSAEFVDTTRLVLNCGGTLIYSENLTNSRRGVFIIVPRCVDNKLSAGTGNRNMKYVGSMKYQDVVKQFTVTLPRNEKGYYVATEDGKVDRVTVNYGEVLAFHVVLNSDYNQGASTMTVYAGEDKVLPDDAGVYYLNYGKLDDGTYGTLPAGQGVRADAEITIGNLLSNEGNARFSGITGGLRNLINIFKKILSYFSDLFSGNGSLSGLSDIFG